MTNEADAAETGTRRKNWQHKSLVTIFLIWLVWSVLLALYTLTADRTITMATLHKATAEARDTVLWTSIACMAAILAGSAVWLACVSLFARRDRSLNELRDTLLPFPPPDDDFISPTVDEPRDQKPGTSALKVGE